MYSNSPKSARGKSQEREAAGEQSEAERSGTDLTREKITESTEEG